MEMSLSIFCAAIIRLLLSDWAVIIAATYVSPLSSGISSESIEELPDLSGVFSWWARTTLFHIGGSVTGHLRFHDVRLVYVLCQSETVEVLPTSTPTCLVYS